MKLKKWSELFPEGRHIFYEGDDPKGFAKEMKEKFSFDPSQNNPGWNKRSGYSFDCQVSALDKVYGNRKYPLGS